MTFIMKPPYLNLILLIACLSMSNCSIRTNRLLKGQNNQDFTIIKLDTQSIMGYVMDASIFTDELEGVFDNLVVIDSFWIPTANNILNIEESIHTFFNNDTSLQYNISIINPKSYFRQYYGVIINNGKYVIIIMLSKHLLQDDSEQSFRYSLMEIKGGGPQNLFLLYSAENDRIERAKANALW